MAKEPWTAWFCGDWLNDPLVTRCSASTRGIWFDLLCHMHQMGRSDRVAGSIEELARMGRCTPKEMQKTVSELASTQAATVRKTPAFVTLICRRLQREKRKRLKTKTRVEKHRCNAQCNAAETDTSQKSNVKSQNQYKVNSQSKSIDLDVDLKDPELERWGRETGALQADVPDVHGERREFLHRIGWLLAAEAPIRDQVKDAIAAVKTVKPDRPVAYLRSCLKESLGTRKLHAMLARCPKAIALEQAAPAVTVSLRGVDDDA